MAASAPHSPGRWLFGPVPDLLLGCGGLYAAIFIASSLFGEQLRPGQADLIFPLLVLAISYPHYGATLLRVYEQRQDRRGYLYFAVHTSILIAALFIAALYLPAVGVVLVTVFLTWSPWHYTGQNYGLAMMFLRRRGAIVDDGIKRWIYASFICSYILTFLVLHEEAGSAADNLSSVYDANGILFYPLGIPTEVTLIVVPIFGIAYLVTLFVAGSRLLRHASFSDISPAVAIAATQALWFSIPFTVRHWGVSTGVEPIDWDFRIHYFVWIALGHAIQYLWVTSYYARASANWTRGTSYYAKVSIAGIAIWTLPFLLFAPQLVGGPSFDTGLAILIASCVNIHHFVLDGAIWKLRNTRIGNVLLRSQSDTEDGEYRGVEPGLRGRRLVWSVAAITAALALGAFWLEEVQYPSAIATRDFASATRSVEQLRWVGRDSARRRASLGRTLAVHGLAKDGLQQLETSVEMDPQALPYIVIGQIEERRNRWAHALAAYQSALRIEPQNATALQHAGIASLELQNPDRATFFLERALQKRPEDSKTRRALQRAREQSKKKPDVPRSPRTS